MLKFFLGVLVGITISTVTVVQIGSSIDRGVEYLKNVIKEHVK